MNNSPHKRLQKLQAQLAADEAILLSNPKDIIYFAQFFSLVPEEREAFLLVTTDQTTLIHSSFSPYQPQPCIHQQKGLPLKKLIKFLAKHKKIKLHLDHHDLKVNEYQVLKKTKHKLLPLDRTQIWQLRTSKDQLEQKKLAQAGQVTKQVMAEVLAALAIGQTEIKVRNLIEAKLKQKGSQRPAFPTIVAFGANTALPHHQPTEAKLKKEMPVLLDFGATIEGYCGDMTRGHWFGQKPPIEYQKIEKVVKEAHQAALQKLKSQTTKDATQDLRAKDLDSAAREIIKKAGYEHQFIHTTGHGLGLDIHESLSLNYKNEQLIKPGMVITLEPGIYLEGKFGYRYENMVLVSKNGAQELTV